jgi:hypothetical protein
MPVKPTYPGVYIEELPSGVRTIVGVSTSVAAFVDSFPRGLRDEAVQIFNMSDFEAEYGGLFAAARIAVDERNILADLGHPQPPTVIYCDNEVAIGLANRTVCPKMSKSLDMRFHWLRDRIDQGQFRVLFVPGLKNLADFFTKALPVARHKVLAPFFAVDDDSSDSIDLRLSTILFAASLFAPRTKRVC